MDDKREEGGARRLDVLGFPLDVVDLAGAADVLSRWMFDPASPNAARAPHTVVTLNPEFIMQAQSDEAFAAAIRAADLVTADGVGIVWAAKQLLNENVPRAPGLDLTVELMKRHGAKLRVFFLGSKPGVAELAAQKAAAQYGVTVAGTHHGYFSPAEDERVATLVQGAQPHLLLTAMGAPRQEVFNQSWRDFMNVPVLIGVGGTLDVLGGAVELAPDWTRRLGVEWVWRVGLNSSRWNRAPRLAAFVRLVLAKRRKGTARA